MSASDDALQDEIVGVADTEASGKGGLQVRESAAALEFRVMDVSCLNSVFGEGWHIQEEYMADPTGCGAKIGTMEICTLKMGKAFLFVLKLTSPGACPSATTCKSRLRWPANKPSTDFCASIR